jgi:hypothetical protein
MSLIRCSFPNCVLEEHLEGDHKFGRPAKPWGELRQTQVFSDTVTAGGVIRCDYCAPERGRADRVGEWLRRAVAFYADMLGFGWALCAECVRRFAPGEQSAVSTQQSAPAPEPAAAPITGSPDHARSPDLAKVLKFEPRAKSQKPKAGVS